MCVDDVAWQLLLSMAYDAHLNLKPGFKIRVDDAASSIWQALGRGAAGGAAGDRVGGRCGDLQARVPAGPKRAGTDGAANIARHVIDKHL